MYGPDALTERLPVNTFASAWMFHGVGPPMFDEIFEIFECVNTQHTDSPEPCRSHRAHPHKGLHLSSKHIAPHAKLFVVVREGSCDHEREVQLRI